ncbi:MAG: glycosyltransferase [Muribaculaceae bacterium]|nr:glycosyltransferase [Muribaculaceae bacterium]MDE5713120.1 glycosyltransferase [Muribaculaceae bacterium]
MYPNPKPVKEEVIVSLTSFPAAISYVVPTVRSILGGSVLPDKVVLYLTFSQFGDEGLPQELTRLAQENDLFEIRDYGRDIRSYRKLVPALRDFPDAVIVTIDDDVAYHKNMLGDLLQLHERIPDAILAHRAKLIRPGMPYKKWRKYRWYHFLFKKYIPYYRNIQTGVGGVLYPPGSLKKEMIDEDLFTRLAPTTDDIWFWAAAVANGRKIVPVPFGHNKPKGVGKPKELSLKTVNFKSGTDRNAAALEAIFKEYPSIRKLVENENRDGE